MSTMLLLLLSRAPDASGESVHYHKQQISERLSLKEDQITITLTSSISFIY